MEHITVAALIIRLKELDQRLPIVVLTPFKTIDPVIKVYKDDAADRFADFYNDNSLEDGFVAIGFGGKDF